MTPIQAFVGHSFAKNDEIVVGKFLKYLDQISEMHPDFTWVHAESAEPAVVDAKVLNLFDGKNLFIAICTKKERVIEASALRRGWFNRVTAKEVEFGWKTSDWIIQEIGVAIGRDLNVILLVEQGLRTPGNLQGNLERIEFEREAPERAFGKLLEMISALSPKTHKGVLVEPESQSSPAEKAITEQMPEGDDWALPKPEWTRQNYEFAFMRSVAIGESEKAQSISDQYLATELGAQKQNHTRWEAFKIYARLVFGKGESLSSLKKLADDNPTAGEVSAFLARAYLRYEEYGNAALTFKHAADTVDDIHRKLQLFGEAVYAFQKDNDTQASNSLLADMRARCADSGQGEANVLEATRKLAEITKEDEILIGTMERQLELSPDDTNTRFALAYKYSEQGNDALAAMHYARISHSERTAVTWNNLGVAFDRLSLQAKSVNAYRKAEEMGETLAMSNLANKLIGSGFLHEAQEICNEAIKLKDLHKNMGATLSRVKEIPEEEDKKEAEAFGKARSTSEFYKEFGRAISRPTPLTLATSWKGPDCLLEVTLEGIFTATGTYEKFSGGGLLGLALIGGVDSSSTPTPDRYRIEYKGTASGQAVVASVVRAKVSERATAATVLGGEQDRVTALLLLSEDGSEIRVIEKPKAGAPRFYSFSPC